MFTAADDMIPQQTPADVDLPALMEGASVLPYSELHAWSNRVARHLISRGVGPDCIVGLLCRRSTEFVAAALGIRKAGAAYLPLDPNEPPQRLAHMLDSAGLHSVLAFDLSSPPNLPPQLPLIDLSSPEIINGDSSPLSKRAEAGDLAYVVYTSGSTGAPKGVCVTNSNLQSLISWHRNAFALTAADRVTFLSPITFDAAAWELWPALEAGATIVLPPEELKRAPEQLRDWLVENRITLSFLPTPLAERMLDLTWPASTALRTMLTGADTLRRYPPPGLPFQLVNNYGPAECTVVSTSGVVAALSAGAAGNALPAIGFPLPGTRIFLLGADGREVPHGSPGEICIAGPGVAQGYLGRPELTAQAFIEWEAPDGPTRLYRSGDEGSWNPDGSLRFLGRADRQVKVRGYRIECGEVEAALLQVAGVKASLVTIQPGSADANRLIAYLAAELGEMKLSRGALREQLGARLPAYMVPDEFILLPAIPVTAHGKLDRDRLPPPTAENIIGDPNEAGSAVEQEVIAILKSRLSVEKVGRDDNFFFLGGHSFAAAQVLGRIRSQFGVELSLRAIFNHPTPAAIARLIEEQIGAQK